MVKDRALMKVYLLKILAYTLPYHAVASFLLFMAGSDMRACLCAFVLVVPAVLCLLTRLKLRNYVLFTLSHIGIVALSLLCGTSRNRKNRVRGSCLCDVRRLIPYCIRKKRRVGAPYLAYVRRCLCRRIRRGVCVRLPRAAVALYLGISRIFDALFSGSGQFSDVALCNKQQRHRQYARRTNPPCQHAAAVHVWAFVHRRDAADGTNSDRPAVG